MANTLTALNSADLWPLLPERVLACAAFALLLFDLFFDARQQGRTQILSMLVLMGVQMIAAGLIGELLMRVYHEAGGAAQFHAQEYVPANRSERAEPGVLPAQDAIDKVA